MTAAEHAGLFQFITLAEFCARPSMTSLPRRVIERYLLAIGRESAIRDGQLLIHWEHLVADLPAFQAYLDHDVAGRPDPQIAARADKITATIWEYANSRKTDRRLPQRLGRIKDRLETLQRKTSPNEAGQRVSDALKDDFPYLEAKHEFFDALEAFRPDRIRRQGSGVSLRHGRPPTVAEEIRIVEFMITALKKRKSARAKPGNELIRSLDLDHQWLGHKPRDQYGSNFGAFVEQVLDGRMSMPEDLRTNLVGVAAALIR